MASNSFAVDLRSVCASQPTWFSTHHAYFWFIIPYLATIQKASSGKSRLLRILLPKTFEFQRARLSLEW